MSNRNKKKLTKPNAPKPTILVATVPQKTISPASTEPAPTPAESETEAHFNQEELRAIRTDIKRSIYTISEQCKTSLASVLQAYGPCVSPTFAHDGDSRFPRPLRRHPRDADRCTEPSYGDILCFLVGNAVISYHEAVLGQPAHHLRARAKQLMEIANDGPGQYVPYGSDTHGFTLMHMDVVRKIEQELGRDV